MLRVTDKQSEKEQNWLEACRIYFQNSANQDRRAKVLTHMFNYIESGKLPFEDIDN